MAYTPTVWINNTPPPLSATNLNKLTNELRAQALELGIAQSLPTWTNGALPALTDAVPLNEIERVTAAVASDLGLSYTVTPWGNNWTPSRNATRLNHIEVQAQANRVAIDAQQGDMPPLPPNGWGAPLVISSGGTYDGTLTGIGWESTSPTTASIRITTPDPVTIKGWVRHTAANGGSSTGSRCIYVATGQAQVTVDHCWVYGGATYQTSGRWFEAANFKAVTIRNCTIQNTRGIQLEAGASPSSVLITKNRHTNIQGNGKNPVGNFVQFRECTNPSPEISWNEITNYYNQSNPEDIIGIYHSSNCNIHDNMFRYQTSPGNPGSSSQGGITMDQISAGSGGNNNIIQDNQMIATEPILIYATTGGNNNSVLDNRCVDSGKIDGGSTNANTRGLGIHVLSGGTNNRAIGNQIGVVHNGSRTVDWKLEGCPGGDAGEGPNNTHLPNPIDVSDETAEWNTWLSKLASNGITIGADA